MCCHPHGPWTGWASLDLRFITWVKAIQALRGTGCLCPECLWQSGIVADLAALVAPFSVEQQFHLSRPTPNGGTKEE